MISVLSISAFADVKFAKFNYKIYKNAKVDAEYSGDICMNLPKAALLKPYDSAQPTVMIQGNFAYLIDYRLEQITKINIHNHPLYQKLSENNHKFCYQTTDLKHCINIYQISNHNCQLSLKFPQNFDFQGEIHAQ